VCKIITWVLRSKKHWSTVNPSKSSGYYMYHQDLLLTLQSPVVTICTTMFNTHKFYVLPTQCIYVFCVDLRTNSGLTPFGWLRTLAPTYSITSYGNIICDLRLFNVPPTFSGKQIGRKTRTWCMALSDFFLNRSWESSLRGTNWIFNYNSG
jgi:hypothetical protein